MRLHWHRRDLRLPDNRALASRPAATPVLGVFVIDEGVHRYASPPRMAFLLDALRSLRADYQELGGDLVVRTGDPARVLPEVAEALGAGTVTAAADYSGLARTRDDRVADRLAEVDVAFDPVHDAVLVPPNELTTTAGDPYSVFSYYGKKWHEREHPEPVALDADWFSDAPVSAGPIPSLDEIGFAEPEATIPPAGTTAARTRLQAFLDEDVFEYADQRDVPAADATSRLSPHLRFGTIGVREVYAATEAARAEATSDAASDSVRTFQDQLAWRDFYAEQLTHHPEMVAANLTAFESPIAWRRDEGDFAAWTAGQTGYPIVDAGMRQLRAEAWMHNRVRMIVASFLTKDLRIDWRWGYEWFREHLVDHDPANDAGGWQWAASTGTDAQPFFRIFNPETQAETHDPDGGYVRRYIEELRDVPAAAIHEWPSLEPTERSELAPAYPSPIVDHADAREEALAMFRAARGETEDD